MKDLPQQSHSLKGNLLIAMPHMDDEVFGRSVIYICSHSKDGAIGIIVNRPLESVTFKDLLSQLKLPTPHKTHEHPIYFGGPVDANKGFILHTTDTMLDSSVPIHGDIALTVNLNFFRELMATETPNRNMLISLGYAGWGEGQLEKEIQAGNWLHVTPTPEILFDPEHTHKWEKAFDTLGINPACLVPRTGRA